MPITRSFLKEIYTQLETGFFSIGDFEIDQEEETDTKYGKITIIYSFDKNFYFEISFEEDFETVKAPGNIKMLEEESVSDKNELFSEIKDWLNNLREELLTGPVIKQFEQFKDDVEKRFEDIEDSYNSLDDKYFSHIEAEDFRERLEKLEKAYLGQIEHHLKNNEKLEEEISRIKLEFEFLKNQLESFTKLNWIKAFVTKALNWGRKNPELVKSLGQITTEFLPENIKKSLPDGVFRN